MKTIALYNNKGGVGKTTLSAHLALAAEARGIRTLAVGLDRQGDLMRWLSAGDRTIRDGDVYDRSTSLSVLYSPDVFPEGLRGLDLVVVDCPPALDVATRAKADLFVVPVDGRLAIQDMTNVLSELYEAGRVMVVFNRADAGGKRVLAAMQHAVARVPRIDVWPEIIPDSGAIKRASEHLTAAWEVPYGAGTEGARRLQRLCDELIDRRW